MADTKKPVGNFRRAFTHAPWRVVVAIVLPFVFATIASQALTFLFLRGADGFIVSVVLLWTTLWTAAFFHCFFDPSVKRIWLTQIIATLFALLPFFIKASS